MQQLEKDAPREYVWDPFVRVSHWTVVTAFFVAYFFTDDNVIVLHVWAGYLVGAFVLLRVVWGFVGPRHARFADFVYRPRTVIDYLVGLLRFSSKRYIGHSPGGGAMIVVLLVCLVLTVGTGLYLDGAREHAGPLSGLFAPATPPTRAEVRQLREIHELFANLTLWLVIIHIAAVVFVSLVHRENLVRSMFTGYKRGE